MLFKKIRGLPLIAIEIITFPPLFVLQSDGRTDIWNCRVALLLRHILLFSKWILSAAHCFDSMYTEILEKGKYF